jgi:hypothetical protein
MGRTGDPRGKESEMTGLKKGVTGGTVTCRVGDAVRPRSQRSRRPLTVAIVGIAILLAATLTASPAQAVTYQGLWGDRGLMVVGGIYTPSVGCNLMDRGPRINPRFERQVIFGGAQFTPVNLYGIHEQSIIYRHTLEMFDGYGWRAANQYFVNGKPLVSSAVRGWKFGGTYFTNLTAGGETWDVPAGYSWRVKSEIQWQHWGTSTGGATYWYSIGEFQPGYGYWPGVPNTPAFTPTVGGGTFGWCRMPY